MSCAKSHNGNIDAAHTIGNMSCAPAEAGLLPWLEQPLRIRNLRQDYGSRGQGLDSIGKRETEGLRRRRKGRGIWGNGEFRALLI